MDHTSRTPRSTSSDVPPAGSDLTGETFGDFRILRQLGQGGMGQVYLAEQISLKRKVAIKLLRDDIADNPTALERFQAESKTVAQLSHANVVQVYMVGEHQGRRYMVLEYVEGKSLRAYLERKGPLSAALALSLMRQVASALHRAGEMGIVHRDIKPENILLTRKGEAKVADFGLSRCFSLDQPVDLTRSGTAVGTPLYMSPEQIEGKVVDYRSDIYSFGVTCYQMLAGHPPFRGSNAFEIALKHVREKPPALEKIRPDIPPAVCALVRKMMAKKPHDRHQSAHELLKDISRVRESLSGTTGAIAVDGFDAETTPAGGTSRTVPVPFWSRPAVRLWGPLVLTLGILLVVFVAVGIAWQHLPASRVAGGPGPAPVAPAEPPPAEPAPEDDRQREREESLKKVVEQHIKDTTPNPGGVEDCIDLAVLYLDQNKVPEAEALFRRMDQRRAPSTYHFVGRLGLAVTDALRNNSRGSRDKFRELFDAKSRDNRVQVLNDTLTKNPEFAKWVNEADSQNVRNGVSESSIPQGLRRFPTSRPPFNKRP